ERINLRLDVLNPQVGLAQILKLFHGLIRSGEGIRHIQHVIPKELVQAGQGLRGLSAVKKKLALHILNPQAFAEASALDRLTSEVGAAAERINLRLDVLNPQVGLAQILKLFHGLIRSGEG
ncbi:hypothetical protein HT105_22785, partial [Bacteroides fragilis]|nr:hypothetical protein [Bacteroides fragilis]